MLWSHLRDVLVWTIALFGHISYRLCPLYRRATAPQLSRSSSCFGWKACWYIYSKSGGGGGFFLNWCHYPVNDCALSILESSLSLSFFLSLFLSLSFFLSLFLSLSFSLSLSLSLYLSLSLIGHLSEICMIDEVMAVLLDALHQDRSPLETLFAIVACEKFALTGVWRKKLGLARKGLVTREEEDGEVMQNWTFLWMYVIVSYYHSIYFYRR